MSRVGSILLDNAEVEDSVIQRAIRLIFSRAGVLVPAHRSSAISRHLTVIARRHAHDSVQSLIESLEANPTHPGWPAFISIFTINHTFFFREAHHFDHLANEVKKIGSQCRIWSSAASTGEEAYSIAMTVLDTLGSYTKLVSPILATDIDANAIDFAKKGVYTEERVQAIGPNRLKAYCLKGVGSNAGRVKMRPAVMDMIHFDTMNLNDVTWPAMQPFDVVFCRNVMIYFNNEAQSRLMERFAKVIKLGGFLYVGHSENMVPFTRQFKLIGQSIYQRVG